MSATYEALRSIADGLLLYVPARLPFACSARFSMVLSLVGLGVFVSAMYAAALLPALAAARLLLWDGYCPWAWAVLALLSALSALPQQWTEGETSRRLLAHICGSAIRYFPISIKLEDEDALKAGGSYVLGYEPHSALPVGVPAVFSTPSPGLPKFLRNGNFHSLASGTCFLIPLVRQLWWWLGLRPATKETIEQILGAGGSVLLCPGGVQECLHMSRKDETVYLRKRQGFVRMAIQHGSALVPVFAFGQCKAYSWWRPGPPLVPQECLEWFSRKAGVAPLVMYGRWATPVPHQAPITIVIGRPIEVPRVAEPPPELVEQYLERFIWEMEGLFERNKAACGCADMQLRVM